MHQLTIRNGTIVDGSGRAGFRGDIAVDGDRIVSVGPRCKAGETDVDATGLMVTPGFVDIHTHYDAQAMWDPEMTPSAWHGVTTAVMGNCGVGFAPAAPARRQQLLNMMEGVEGIPSAALAAGMPWHWETFPEYLDALGTVPRTLDVGTQIPHAAVRNYVMGERCWDPVYSTSEMSAMADIVEEALRAGALGFSTNRHPGHKDLANVPIPGTFASAEELFAIGRGIQRAGHGVLEVALDPRQLTEPFQWEWMTRISLDFGVPVSFELVQHNARSGEWRRVLELLDAANQKGAHLRAQVANRSVAFFMGWQLDAHPFQTRQSWKSIADKPWSEKLEALRDPHFRAKLLSDDIGRADTHSHDPVELMLHGWDKQFVVGKQPDYEPGPRDSIASLAAARNCSPAEFAYDAMTAHGGSGLLYLPIFNYSSGDLDAVAEMLEHPATVLSLSDGGAHCLSICDASLPTFALTHWARDRTRGSGTVPLETVVKWQTSDTAELYALNDRGQLRAGLLADINVVDMENLALLGPYLAHDLPTGRPRLLQKAAGYRATVKSGKVTFRDGNATGERPGAVIRFKFGRA